MHKRSSHKEALQTIFQEIDESNANQVSIDELEEALSVPQKHAKTLRRGHARHAKPWEIDDNRMEIGVMTSCELKA